MDIKEYINSGAVEMYIMGAMSSSEKTEFEQKLLLYTELRKEYFKAQETFDEYAQVHSLNPRPELRSKILDSISAEDKSTTKKKVIRIRENPSLTYKYMVAACLAALVISTFASWFFYTKWDGAEDRYTALLNDKNQLAVNYNLVKMEFDRNSSDLMVMRDFESKVIQLNAIDSSRNYEARVYWNKNTREAYIDVLSLPIPPDNQQYQLWALVAGKPIDAGVFDMGNDGIQKLKDIDKADAWAVTLEPKGGSLAPTMNQMYLLGKNS